MIRSPYRAVAALLVLFALTGCSPGSRPVARVGNCTLTVDDLSRAALGAAARIPLPPDQGRAMLLDNLVRREMMLVAAQKHGLDTVAATRQFRATVTEQALLAAISQALTPADPGVTDAEMRTLYEWQRTKSDVQVVFAPDRAMLGRARAELEAGADFGQVADMYGAGTLPPGGKLGMLQPGTLPLALDHAVQTLPVGVLGGPYETPQGWYLMKVLRRVPAEPAPYDQALPGLRQQVRQRKWQAAFLGEVAKLERGYHVVVSPEAAPTLTRLLRPSPGDDTAVHWTPGPEDLKQVFATFDGGTYTFGDAMDDMQRPDVDKPNATMTPALTSWVRERVMSRVAMAEARRRHLDQEPEVTRQVRDKVDDYVLRGEIALALASVPTPDPSVLRPMWESMKERYPQLQLARVAWFTTTDTAAASAVARHAGEGSLADVARAVDPSAQVQVEVLRFPNPDPQWAASQELLTRMQPGQWSGPDFIRTGWRVMQLLDKQQGPLSWDQLPPNLQQAVASSAVERQRQDRATAYTDSLRRAINPVLLTDALRFVPWPSAPPVEP